MPATYFARCTCGAFSFNSTSAPILQLTCHCQQCREASKAPFTSFAFFKKADATITGETVVREFVADSGSKTFRESCASCGELLLDRTEAYPKIVGIVVDRIQAPYVFEPRCHVWLESKVVDPAIPAGVKAFSRGME